MRLHVHIQDVNACNFIHHNRNRDHVNVTSACRHAAALVPTDQRERSAEADITGDRELAPTT